MNQPPFASSLAPFLLAALSLASSGCAVQAVGGVEPPPFGAGVTALALLGSAIADPSDYLDRGLIDVQPDTLYVFIGNFEETCGDPFPPVCVDPPSADLMNQWQIIVGIPAGLQQEGTLPLPTAEGQAVDIVVAVGNENPGSPPTSSCWADSPAFVGGEVEIASIDATQVTVNFVDVQNQLTAAQGPGSVIDAAARAPRCP